MLYRVAGQRRLVCERNISVCFPALPIDAQHNLVQSCFIESGKGLVETAWAWHRPLDFVKPRMQIEGAECLRDAHDAGKGILLLCPHYSMLDLVAPLVYQVYGRFVITYRPNDNPAFNEAVCQGRLRYADLIEVRAIREIARALKQGELVWFGPDQDMGTKGSVFADFLDVRHQPSQPPRDWPACQAHGLCSSTCIETRRSTNYDLGRCPRATQSRTRSPMRARSIVSSKTRWKRVLRNTCGCISDLKRTQI